MTETICFIALTLLLTGSAGCIPAVMTPMPQINGVVLDTNRRPVPGAEVRFKRIDSEDPKEFTLRSDKAGRFTRPAEWRLSVMPLFADLVWDRYEVTACAGRERSKPEEFCGGREFFAFGYVPPGTDINLTLFIDQPPTASPK